MSERYFALACLLLPVLTHLMILNDEDDYKTLSQHKIRPMYFVCASVGQSGQVKYACPVIEVRRIDGRGSCGSRDLLYGDSIALIGVCRSKMLKSAEF